MAVQTITYDDKQYLNQNSEIADVNKINDTDMNEIKTVVNNNATELTNVINAEEYSINEVKTNKVWIDGKPIYRKVINCGNLPNNTTKQITHGISNMSTTIKINGTAIRSTDNDTLPIPYITFNANNSGGIVIYIDSTNIVLRTTTDRSAYVGYVTLEYTKLID